MIPQRTIPLALLILTLFGSTGCSAIMGRKPSQEAWQSIDRVMVPPADACTHTGPLPYVETVVALGTGLLGASILIQDQQHQCSEERGCLKGLGTAVSIPILLAAAGAGASAWYGFDVNAECERYHAAWAERQTSARPPWTR